MSCNNGIKINNLCSAAITLRSPETKTLDLFHHCVHREPVSLKTPGPNARIARDTISSIQQRNRTIVLV